MLPQSARGKDDVCPICKGLGVLLYNVPPDDPRYNQTFPCSCQAEATRQRQLERLRTLGNLDPYLHMTFETFEIDYDQLDADQGGLRAVFRDLAERRRMGLNAEQRRDINVAAQVAYHYAHDPNGWLLFEGSYGTGKTHLAAAIANFQVERGNPVLLITTPDLLDHLRGTYGPSSEVAYDELFDQIRNAPLLVMDDLGAESQTPWAMEKLYQIVSHRHVRRLPTVITTNYDLILIEPRIRSRLLDQDLTRSVRLSIPDRRSPVVGWAEADLTNLDRYASMTFDSFDLRGGEGLPEPLLRRLEETVQVAQTFAEAPHGWLTLSGPPGNGKTHLAAAVAHRVAARGERVLFVTVVELLSYLRATFHPAATISYDRRMSELKGAELLILDDLSITPDGMSSWAREKLYEILIYRFDYALPTLITTNQPLDKMDARLRSRLENQARVHIETVVVPAYTGPAQRRAAPPRRALRG
jgi:DNA replication protein DnaC